MGTLADYITNGVTDAGTSDTLSKTVGVNSLGQIRKFPVISPGLIKGANLNSDATLTLVHVASGILKHPGSGTRVLTIPTLTTLGHTYDDSNPIQPFFSTVRTGTGPFFVNPVGSGVTIYDPDDLAIGNAPQWSIRTYVLVGVNIWTIC